MAEISREIKIGMAEYLRQVAAHLHGISPDELIEIQQNLEAHLYEALLSRAPEGPTMDDLRAVLAEMPLPESFGEGAVELPLPAPQVPAAVEWGEQPTLVMHTTPVNSPTIHVLLPQAATAEEEATETAPVEPSATPAKRHGFAAFWHWLHEVLWELVVAAILLPFSLNWLAKALVAFWLSDNYYRYTYFFNNYNDFLSAHPSTWPFFSWLGTMGWKFLSLDTLTFIAVPNLIIGAVAAIITSLLAYFALIRLVHKKSSTAALSLALFIYYLYPTITPTVIMIWISSISLMSGNGGLAFLVAVAVWIIITIPQYFLLRRWVRGWWKAYEQAPVIEGA